MRLSMAASERPLARPRSAFGSRKPFISGLAGGQFVQYGGAFFAEFRLIGADQGQREAQTAEAGQVRLAFAAGLAEAFCASRSAGTASPPSRKAMMP